MPLPASTLSMVGLPLPGDSMYKKPRQGMIVRMSAETFDALDDPQNHRKLEVEFGDNPGLHIGGQFFPVQHTPENGNHELYIRVSQANKPSAPLKLYANVIGKFMVERQLGEKVQETVRDRTKQAEEARTERKTILLDKPPTQPKASKQKKKEVTRRVIPSSTSYAVPKAAVASPRVAPLPAPSASSSKTSPLHASGQATSSTRATAGASSSKASPPHPSASHSNGAAAEAALPSGIRGRLIHLLALKSRTQEATINSLVGRDATSRVKNDLVSLLQVVAESVRVAKNSDPSSPQRWQLKLESWREVRPYEWPDLKDEERTHLARQARTAYKDLRIPQDDPIWEVARYQPAPGAPGSAAAGARAPGEKNGVVMTKKAKSAGEGVRNRKQVSDIMIPAKDEGSRNKARDLDESSAAGTPTSATRPAVRRQPGSGYRVAKHSATPPVSDLRSNSPLPPPKKLAPPDPREGRRDPQGSSASTKPPPSPAQARSSSVSAAAAQIRKKPKDSQAAAIGRSAGERREERMREREREHESDKPRAKAAASPVPPPLPSFKRKKPVQDNNDSEYSEREVPLSAGSSKKRKLDEPQPGAAEKARGRDLSLPKKPVLREPSPLSAPRMKIKKEASPLSTAFSPPRSTSVRSSLPPRPAAAADRAHHSSSSSSSSTKNTKSAAEPARSGKSRRESAIYTSSSEDESERSVPVVRDRTAPEAHSPPEDPTPKRFKATHTPLLKQRPLPKDRGGLRKYYEGCWRTYHELHKTQMQRRDQLERLLQREEGRGYADPSDEDMDMGELEPDVLEVFMEDLNAVTKELQKVRQAYERLGDRNRDSLGELVDVC